MYKTKLTFIICFLQVLLELQIHKKIKKSRGQFQWPHTPASLKMELSPREHRSFFFNASIGPIMGRVWPLLTDLAALPVLGLLSGLSPCNLFSTHALDAFMLSLLTPDFCLRFLCVHLSSAFCNVSWPLSNP